MKNILKNYKKLNNCVKKKIRTTKRQYYKTKFENADPKSIWETINEIITTKEKVQKTQVNYLTINQKNIMKEEDICEEMNRHFIDVGPSLASNISNIQTPTTDVPNPNSMFLYEETITENDLSEIITNLNSRKATGHDNISVKIIKLVKNELIPILKTLVCLSLKLSIFPEQMKLARVTPIFKSGDCHDPNNFRPVSVLPALSKILEKVMHKKLNSFLEKNKILCDSQYGFRNSRDTEAAALDIVTDIQLKIDKNEKCCLLSLDLRKAFDTVDHNILLNILWNYGIRGKIYNWFKNYLENRKQYVKINGYISSKKQIICGVPQGSVLGPILFLIYINSITNLKLNGKITLFADDTTIIYFGKKISDIKYEILQDLKIIQDWLNSKKLTINFDKSSYMFLSKNQLSENTTDIKFNNNSIKYRKCVKFLGLHIDENLSWKNHITNLRNSLSHLVGVLFKVRYYIPLIHLKKIYYALFYSKIQYLISIWGSANMTILNPLNKLQNKVLKCIHKLPFLEPTINLYKPLGYLNLEDLYKAKICIFIHSMILKTKITNIYLKEINVLHNHQTRQENMLQTIRFKSNIGQKSLIYNGIINYNKLPKELKKIHRLDVLK